MLLRNRKGVTTSTWHLFYIRYIRASCGSSNGYPFEVCEDKLPWPYSQGFEGFMHVGVCHTTSNFHEFDGITPPSQAGHDGLAGCWHFSVCLAHLSSKISLFQSLAVWRQFQRYVSQKHDLSLQEMGAETAPPIFIVQIPRTPITTFEQSCLSSYSET
jgi:hypothetical protein